MLEMAANRDYQNCFASVLTFNAQKPELFMNFRVFSTVANVTRFVTAKHWAMTPWRSVTNVP